MFIFTLKDEVVIIKVVAIKVSIIKDTQTSEKENVNINKLKILKLWTFY